MSATRTCLFVTVGFLQSCSRPPVGSLVRQKSNWVFHLFFRAAARKICRNNQNPSFEKTAFFSGRITNFSSVSNKDKGISCGIFHSREEHTIRFRMAPAHKHQRQVSPCTMPASKVEAFPRHRRPTEYTAWIPWFFGRLPKCADFR